MVLISVDFEKNLLTAIGLEKTEFLRLVLKPAHQGSFFLFVQANFNLSLSPPLKRQLLISFGQVRPGIPSRLTGLSKVALILALLLILDSLFVRSHCSMVEYLATSRRDQASNTIVIAPSLFTCTIPA